MAQPILEGYHTVTPYLIVKGATNAVQFYQEAFGARELMRLEAPGKCSLRPRSSLATRG